jgi:hypothetical protein
MTWPLKGVAKKEVFMECGSSLPLWKTPIAGKSGGKPPHSRAGKSGFAPFAPFRGYSLPLICRQCGSSFELF